MGRTLNDFLTQAGVKVAGAAPAAPAPAAPAAPAAAPVAKTAAAAPKPAVVAAPAKTAGDIAPAQPSAGEASDGHKPRVKKTETEAQDTGKAAAVTKTAAQIALSSKGIDVADAKIAEIVYGDLVKQAELEKRAELEKHANELRAQGALMYQGMCIESTAIKIATGEANLDEARAIAGICGVDVSAITKRAEQIGGAMSSPALVGGMLGSAARTESSKVMGAAERNGSTTETRDIEAIQGTRGATSGADDKLKRFTDVHTLPGNPGLNHGQVVDQGKKLGQ